MATNHSIPLSIQSFLYYNSERPFAYTNILLKNKTLITYTKKFYLLHVNDPAMH